MTLQLRDPSPADLAALHATLSFGSVRMPGTPRYVPIGPSWPVDLWPDHIWFAAVASGDEPIALAVLHGGNERDRVASISLLHAPDASNDLLGEACEQFSAAALDRWPLRRLVWPVVAGSATEEVASAAGFDRAMVLTDHEVVGGRRCDVSYLVRDRDPASAGRSDGLGRILATT